MENHEVIYILNSSSSHILNSSSYLASLYFLWKERKPEYKHTLSGRIGKVVASHAEGCNVERSIPAVTELHRFILCTRRSGGTAHVGGGCDQLIGSTVSDAIVRSWLWFPPQLGVPHWATSVITASSWLLTPHSVVVDFPLGGSWP